MAKNHMICAASKALTTAFDRRILQSPRIPYFCAKCAGSIDVPTGTELCHACLRAQKVAA